jgi:hypothetical protein
MKYYYMCPRCGKMHDCSEEFLFCGGCGEKVHKEKIVVRPDGKSINYVCCFCSAEMEYDGEAKFCGSCGNNIVTSAVRICDGIKRINRRIEKNDEFNDSRLGKLIMENYRKKLFLEFYKEYCADGETTFEQALENSDAEVKKVEDKLVTQRRSYRLFMTDEMYVDCWNHYCKRLFPEQKKGGSISPVHIFNAYLMCKNRRDYLGAYSFSQMYVVQKNNVYFEGTNQDTNIYRYCGTEKNMLMVLPSYNVVEYGYEHYSELFDAQFSEKNTEKTYNRCYVKAACTFEKKDDSLTLLKKGVIVYITEEEYNFISDYYNEVINIAEHEEGRDLYYYMLDELYDKYSNKDED